MYGLSNDGYSPSSFGCHFYSSPFSFIFSSSSKNNRNAETAELGLLTADFDQVVGFLFDG